MFQRAKMHVTFMLSISITKAENISSREELIRLLHFHSYSRLTLNESARKPLSVCEMVP